MQVMAERRRKRRKRRKGTLIFERCPHGLHDRVPNIRRLVYDVKVLPARFADDSGVALVCVDILRDVFPQFLQHESATREMKRRKARVGDDLSRDFLGWSGDKLDDAGRYTSLRKQLVYQPVGVSRGRRGLPYHNISKHSRGWGSGEFDN